MTDVTRPGSGTPPLPGPKKGTSREETGAEATPGRTASQLCVLGVDPGISGGLAFFEPSDPGSIIALDIPIVAGEIDVGALARTLREMSPVAAVVERAASMPKQGVASTFRYGQAYGALRGVIAALGIPTHLVAPTVWKKHYRLSADKETSRGLALRLWPASDAFARKKDHGRAEAALIARFGFEVLGLGRRS